MTYYYIWEDKGYTEKKVFKQWLPEGFVESIRQGFIDELEPKIIEAFFTEHMINARVDSIDSVEVWLEEFPTYYGYTPVRVHYHIIAKIKTDKPILTESVPIWLMKIVKWVIEAVILIIVGYFAVEAIKQTLYSMVTKTHKITRYDPETGNIIEEEEWEDPSPIPWHTILIVAVFLILAYFAFKYYSSPRRRRRKK